VYEPECMGMCLQCVIRNSRLMFRNEYHCSEVVKFSFVTLSQVIYCTVAIQQPMSCIPISHSYATRVGLDSRH
jgi:hypothetical protein